MAGAIFAAVALLHLMQICTRLILARSAIVPSRVGYTRLHQTGRRSCLTFSNEFEQLADLAQNSTHSQIESKQPWLTAQALRPRRHSFIFITGAVNFVGYWLPSHRVIKLDCVVVEQKPARSIVPSPERFLGTFRTPKGSNHGLVGNEQSDWRPIEGSRRHRARIRDYHGRSASRLPRVTPLANHFGYIGVISRREQIDSILRCNYGDPLSKHGDPFLERRDPMIGQTGDEVPAGEKIHGAGNRRAGIFFSSALARRDGGGHGPDRSAAAMASAASRLLRAYTIQVETLRRFRSGGSQLVRVEHVHVNEGGQAVIGPVAVDRIQADSALASRLLITNNRQPGGTMQENHSERGHGCRN